jgi:hypothetical protein
MPLELMPGTILEDRDVMALVALSAGGVVPQDARTLQVYERLRLAGLAQRRDLANDPYGLPAFGLTEDGETALRFNWTAIAEIIEGLARKRAASEARDA